MDQNRDFYIEGNIVDVVAARIFPGKIQIKGDRINSIEETGETYSHFILPGLVDAHIHIESSMLIPSEFARLAVIHGTVATVSDPHEIGNVLGIEGVNYMIENGSKVPFYFNFGAPSCVPATKFETAGAEINASDIDNLLQRKDIKYLSEMMNYPGVLHDDPEVLQKLKAAKDAGKPIDGHAPGLRGKEVKKYIEAGISTDHESFTAEEAQEKLQLGMKILIREGSAAKNFDALIDLLKDYPDKMMFCSDDKHPNDLIRGHINELLSRVVKKGIDPLVAIKAATLNPVRHYGLENGLLQKNDSADMIVVDDIENFRVIETYVKGRLVAKNGKTFIDHIEEQEINNFHTKPVKADDLKMKAAGKKIRVIEALDRQLITNEAEANVKARNGFLISDTGHDILKLVVVNRYQHTKPAIGFVKNFGFKEGAIASSVAHDSHNIIAVGVKNEEIADAVNAIIEHKGGVSLVKGDYSEVLPLPVGGLMSNKDGFGIAEAYDTIDKKAKTLGSKLASPFMTLSFMALLVIPDLKLSDKGLFSGKTFTFVPVIKG